MEKATDETKILPNAVVIGALEQLLDTMQLQQQNYTYEIQGASAKGDNYIGVVYRVLVYPVGDDKEKRDKFRLILKVPPQNQTRRKQFFARPCFLREALAYDEYLPLVREFQRDKNVPTHDGFHEYPEYYMTLTEEMSEAIFIEDLCVKHFALYNRFDELTFDHVELVMKVYAKLHAVSFAIADQAPKKLDRFQRLEDIFKERKDDQQMGAYFEGLRNSTLACLSQVTDGKYAAAFRQYFECNTFFDLFLELLDGKLCEPYAVVCHGDCWNNNILYKHENGKVVDARLLDWQVMRYASPVTDLMYFLFTCTTKAFRDLYYEQMLDTYYKELSAHIERLGSEPKALFPRTIFNRELKSKGAIGLLFAMMLLPIVTMKGEDTPDLEKLSEKIDGGAITDLKDSGFLNENNKSAYSVRMRDVVIDCVDFGYI